MKTATLFAIPALMFASACAMDFSDGDIGLAEDNLFGVEKSSVHSLADGSEIAGGKAELERGEELTFELKTTATVGDAVTVWVCGWTDPSECVGGSDAGNQCGMPDMFSSSFFCEYGGGNIVDEDGELEIEGGEQGGEVIFGGGIPAAADQGTTEIHLVVWTHGQASSDADELAAQLTTFGGGCGGDPDPCADIQFAIFQVSE